jgi:hypothetical protein
MTPSIGLERIWITLGGARQTGVGWCSEPENEEHSWDPNAAEYELSELYSQPVRFS